MRETEREAETQAEEKQAPHGEPNVGLKPRTTGSQPEPKPDAQPLSCPGAPINKKSFKNYILYNILTKNCKDHKCTT